MGEKYFELETDYLILGAGLAGTMMARVLSDSQPSASILVVDSRPSPSSRNHWALLRFRDLETARALGVAVKEIEVEKAVYWKGKLHYHADLAMNNTYSLKAYGHIGNRSLKQLGLAKRYLPLSSFQPQTVLWGHKFVSASEDRCVVASHCELPIDPDYEAAVGTSKLIDYDTCISTLPMQELAGLLPRTMREQLCFVSEPITVLRAAINPEIRIDVNQTIYFPERRFNTYRATLEGNTFVLEAGGGDDESIDDIITNELQEVIEAFGIPFSKRFFSDELSHDKFKVQKLGKTQPLEDDLRKAVIYELTDRYKIYSVGRFATWRPLRADQLVKDVYKVERMIRQGEIRTRYERRLGE